MLVDNIGRVPYQDSDNTRDWVEQHTIDGRVAPWCVLRIATDTSYMLNQNRTINAYGTRKIQTKALMNVALPGLRIPHVLSWSVNEALDQPVQTANFEMTNALQLSTVTTTLATPLAQQIHNPVIHSTYVENSKGVVSRLDGNVRVEDHIGSTGIPYAENDVHYRVYMPQSFDVESIAGFPDPGVPADDDGYDVELTYGEVGVPLVRAQGVGQYFLLIDQEVVQVSMLAGNSFQILPGGRAVNGYLQNHNIGAKVTLLGMGPSDRGKYAAFGYLTPDDFKPYKHLLRPGTCITSYEGYGEPPTKLSHFPKASDNYAFTGYWFVKGLECSLDENMQPRLRVDLVSAGELLNKQQITPDLVLRIKTQAGKWNVKGKDIFGVAGHVRDIPGDWVDYNSWDSTLKDAYPLKIKTLFAQHKAFFDHMTQFQMGVGCEQCLAERKDYLANNPNPDTIRDQWASAPAGAAKDRLGQQLADAEMAMAKQNGQHIYKESIRVLHPLKTYIRLMATMAAMAWDHPAHGTELAQRFSKIPNKLFDNIRELDVGLVYNGQVNFEILAKEDVNWEEPGYDVRRINAVRKPTTCPFESTYDKTPFFQPISDLADANGNVFWIDRHGRPCFMPPDYPMRPYAHLSDEQWEWFVKHGASITSYSFSLNTDQLFTQCWVTANTAFDGSIFTVPAAGTGFSSTGERVLYSSISGNKDGLALTSGVQSVTTAEVEGRILGLDWNTIPEKWGVQQTLISSDNDKGKDQTLNAVPDMYPGQTEIGKGSHHTKWTRQVQQTINFFLIRRYLPPISYNSQFYYTIPEDGKFGGLTEKALVDLQTYVLDNTPNGSHPNDRPEANLHSNATAITAERTRKNYGRDTYLWVHNWVYKVAPMYIKTDIWWYLFNGREWSEYVAAMTGLAIPLRSTGVKRKTTTKSSTYMVQTPMYRIDMPKFYAVVQTWFQKFAQDAVNIGNRIVDKSINVASVRSVSSNYADPRIQPGDVLWCDIPGHLAMYDVFGRVKSPFTNGIYVTQVQRQLDMTPGGQYTASYSGYRFRGDNGKDRYGAQHKSDFNGGGK